MSKIQALELAVRIHGIYNAPTPASEIVATAAAFAAFLNDETPTVAPVVADAPPAKVRKVKAVEPPPVVAVVEETPKPEVVEETPKPKAVEKVAPAVEPEKLRDGAETMRKLIGTLAVNTAAGGATKAREVLGKYGASNFSTLKPVDYAAATEEIQKILAAAEATA
jgi:hypothetical protein